MKYSHYLFALSLFLIILGCTRKQKKLEEALTIQPIEKLEDNLIELPPQALGKEDLNLKRKDIKLEKRDKKILINFSNLSPSIHHIELNFCKTSNGKNCINNAEPVQGILLFKEENIFLSQPGKYLFSFKGCKHGLPTPQKNTSCGKAISIDYYQSVSASEEEFLLWQKKQQSILSMTEICNNILSDLIAYSKVSRQQSLAAKNIKKIINNYLNYTNIELCIVAAQNQWFQKFKYIFTNQSNKMKLPTSGSDALAILALGSVEILHPLLISGINLHNQPILPTYSNPIAQANLTMASSNIKIFKTEEAIKTILYSLYIDTGIIHLPQQSSSEAITLLENLSTRYFDINCSNQSSGC